MQSFGPRHPLPYAARAPVANVLPFVRRVYSLLTAGIAFAIAGAMVALYAGGSVSVPSQAGAMEVPPVVAFELQHGIIMMLLFFAAFFGASSRGASAA